MQCLHPDYLLPLLTWEQFNGWQQAYDQEPWGESRDDQRMAAQTMYLKSAIEWKSGGLPELIYPYFKGTDKRDLLSQKEWLDEKKREYNEKRQRREDTGALDGG